MPLLELGNEKAAKDFSLTAWADALHASMCVVAICYVNPAAAVKLDGAQLG